MFFYRVKEKYDQLYNHNKDIMLIGKELFTPLERQKLPFSDNCFECVELPIEEVEFFFGARFHFPSEREDSNVI